MHSSSEQNHTSQLHSSAEAKAHTSQGQTDGVTICVRCICVPMQYSGPHEVRVQL